MLYSPPEFNGSDLHGDELYGGSSPTYAAVAASAMGDDGRDERVLNENRKKCKEHLDDIVSEELSPLGRQRKMADLEEKFLINSAKVLNPNQQAKLGLFKNKMMRNMKGKMKDKRSRDKKRKFRNDRKKNKREFWN